MEVGILQSFQNFRDEMSDAERMEQALALADLYEPLGFDFCLAAEHHFHNYTMSPAPFDFLSWLAGRTKRMRIGPGVIIVPWNDPYRAAAHMIMLDHLSRGRAIIGFGRGLSRGEMDLFGIDMNETRAMFDEGAAKILEAVTTGSFPGGGQYYSAQRRSPMRPAPRGTDWASRMLCVGMSPPSATAAGQLGARLMSFAQVPWSVYRETHLAPYLETFRAEQRREPLPLVIAETVIAHEDTERARELAYRYAGQYYDSVMEFYRFDDGVMKGIKGYESYAKLTDDTAHIAHEDKRTGYVEQNLYGTPAEILEKLRERRETLGFPFDSCLLVDFGGTPTAVSEHTLRVLGEKVLPVVQKWGRDFR
jgi:alkanesulfonate monooxygenase SsuD/methylene tetrahydromethanopterin reductase-like flavin-dependent oxidoreductase (luciferase family)